MIYDKLIIYYYTGTGNALKASEWIISEAKNRGIVTHIHAIDRNYKPNVQEFTANTLFGFCYPTHGFNAVPAMLSFMSKFPKVAKNHAFLLNTRAGMKIFNYNTPGLSGIALLLPMLILFLRNFNIRGAYPLDMPSNWISIHPGLNQNSVRFIINACEKKTKKFIQTIFLGKRHLKRMCIDIPLDILIVPISFGYYFIGRFFLAKTLIYTRECNSCQLCVKNCPVEAIKIVNGKPFWTHNCESCMRCIAYCPQKSIQASHLIFFSGLLLFFIPFTDLLSNILFDKAVISNEWLIWIIDTIIAMSFLYFLYAVIQKLLKYTWIEVIFRYTSITYYWRRYKTPGYKFSDLKKHE